MRLQYIIAYLTTIPGIQATFIQKRNIDESSVLQQCNGLPSAQYCAMDKPVEGSVEIGNTPTYIDIAGPCNENRAAAVISNREQDCCKNVQLSDIQFGDLSCLTGSELDTDISIVCGSRFDARTCFSQCNHQKRDMESSYSLSLSDLGEQKHSGCIDAEESSLPPQSYHDAYGNHIDWDEFNRLADLELEHEASGTLHLLYPDLYEAPLERRGHDIDISIYIDKGCHGERLVRIHHEGCHNTLGGAGIFLHSLPNNCRALTYTRAHCQGSKHLDIGAGAAQSCFDSGNFNSLKVKCAVF